MTRILYRNGLIIFIAGLAGLLVGSAAQYLFGVLVSGSALAAPMTLSGLFVFIVTGKLAWK